MRKTGRWQQLDRIDEEGVLKGKEYLISTQTKMSNSDGNFAGKAALFFVARILDTTLRPPILPGVRDGLITPAERKLMLALFYMFWSKQFLEISVVEIPAASDIITDSGARLFIRFKILNGSFDFKFRPCI